MRTRLTSALLLSLVLLFTLTACAATPQKLIVGTWQSAEGDVLTFNRDGTMAGSPLSAFAVPGTYAFDDDTHITMVWNGPDLELMGGTWYADIPIALSAEITTLTDDTLVLDFLGSILTFTRVR